MAKVVFRQRVMQGGIGELTNETEFPPESVQEGMIVELEHTTNARLAKEIALDHLREDPRYYKKLKKMEGAHHG